jgi:sugar lactone lactonase YvrE
MSWTALTAEPDALGESPFWHPQEQRLYWVDIAGRCLHRMAAAGQDHERWPMPQEPGCIAPARSGGLVIALRDGIYRAPRWGAALQRLAVAHHDPASQRFNDGKCDPMGRFWAGTIYEPRDRAGGSLQMLDARSAKAPLLQTMIEQATVSNGLAFSPDGQRVYWADTPTHEVQVRDWDPVAKRLGPARRFHQFPAKPPGWTADAAGQVAYGGRPDGATVDARGNYLVALYEGQRLCRLDPQGQLLEVIPTPVRCPTMPCLGGPDLQTLFITTARQGRSGAELAAQPQAGCVFSMRVGEPGLPVSEFDDQGL